MKSENPTYGLMINKSIINMSTLVKVSCNITSWVKGLSSFVAPPLVPHNHYMWLEFVCFLENLSSFEIENT